MIRFGIVTPCFNAAATIEATIASISSQTGEGFTVDHLVKDGLSRDDTAAIVARHPHVRWVAEKDRGQSDALNAGFARVEGEILAWQNADDLYLPGCLATVAAFFEAHPEVDIVYAPYQLIDGEGQLITHAGVPSWASWRLRLGRFVPMQPTAFWRRRVWESIKPVDTSLRYCMDVDFFARADAAGFKFARIDQELGAFRMHAGSLTAAQTPRLKIAREHLSVLQRAYALAWWERGLFWTFQGISAVLRKWRTGSF